MKIQIPTHCPCCASKLELRNEQLFCVDKSCSAQLNKKLSHFAKTIGIKGLGDKTIEKLELGDLTELYYLDLDSLIESLGSSKIAEKLLAEIDNSRNADLATVLASFSIPLCGSTASQKLCTVVSSIEEISTETCKKAGLGDKVTSNILNWIETEYQEMKEFLPFSFKTSNKQVLLPGAMSVCITGKLSSFKTKAEAQIALTAAGYAPVESVTKQTDYLVDEDNKGSSKRKKADSLGIPIITDLQQFLREI